MSGLLVRASLSPELLEDLRTPGLEEISRPFPRPMREVHVDPLASREAVDGEPAGRPVRPRDPMHRLEGAAADVVSWPSVDPMNQQ